MQDPHFGSPQSTGHTGLCGDGCLSPSPFRSGCCLLIFVPHLRNDGLAFAAGISPSLSQAATSLGHHSIPLRPFHLLRALPPTGMWDHPCFSSITRDISSESLVIWIPLLSSQNALFSLYTLISLLSFKNLIVVSNRKYSSIGSKANILAQMTENPNAGLVSDWDWSSQPKKYWLKWIPSSGPVRTSDIRSEHVFSLSPVKCHMEHRQLSTQALLKLYLLAN